MTNEERVNKMIEELTNDLREALEPYVGKPFTAEEQAKAIEDANSTCIKYITINGISE